MATVGGEVFLFVPGFFGFGSFGHPDRPFIEYFARVEDALLRAHVRPARFVVHQPPPAASKLHLVGHSAGGLDARLLANSAYAALPERGDLIARVASLVTVSAPFHGTPLADREGGAA